MVDLRKKPYYLSEEQVQWVEDTIKSMTIEEKIGQLFVNMVTDRSPEALKEVIEEQEHITACCNGARNLLASRNGRTKHTDHMGRVGHYQSVKA